MSDYARLCRILNLFNLAEMIPSFSPRCPFLTNLAVSFMILAIRPWLILVTRRKTKTS